VLLLLVAQFAYNSKGIKAIGSLLFYSNYRYHLSITKGLHSIAHTAKAATVYVKELTNLHL
jgi:hypothetical protein